MITSYSGFTSVTETEEILHITVRRSQLFPTLPQLEPSVRLQETLAINRRLPLGNEKAKSEMLVAPVLSEIWLRNEAHSTLYSGYTLDVDREQGLTGRCGFIFSAENNIVVKAPIITIVEAKNDNVDEAVPQCAAQLYAAQIFNERNGRNVPILYGATTTGLEWLFVKLIGSVVTVDTDVYQLRALPELLGVLQHIINYYKELPPTTDAL
ncbi:MAG: hypothetical protein MUF71_11755 [Candidatus Kapabacteria bacterium]|jgi:hypothetical protein|nr:hypothetical protein [Candidatus Kapabacteria bacterium]